jgi:hypothetical protein
MRSRQRTRSPGVPAPLLRHAGVTLGHFVLNLDGATYRIDNTGELNQEPAASRLYRRSRHRAYQRRPSISNVNRVPSDR